MTTTNDAPAPAIRCTYCGDTRMITDRVDGEITCPECGYDAPAPAPSGNGVRVKPLEWRSHAWGCEADGGRYRIEDNGTNWTDDRYWLFVDVGLLSNHRSKHATLDEAKAAAQAGYEARIRASLASDASPRGEPVAWRFRYPLHGGKFTHWEFETDADRIKWLTRSESEAQGEPLYAHPAPATVESARVSSGCFDKDGNELFVGDRVRHNFSGPHTKEEYWNPEYEIVFDPPSFTLKHIGGGKDGGQHLFILKYGRVNGDLELISRAALAPAIPATSAETGASVGVKEAASMLDKLVSVGWQHRLQIKPNPKSTWSTSDAWTEWRDGTHRLSEKMANGFNIEEREIFALSALASEGRSDG